MDFIPHFTPKANSINLFISYKDFDPTTPELFNGKEDYNVALISQIPMIDMTKIRVDAILVDNNNKSLAELDKLLLIYQNISIYQCKNIKKIDLLEIIKYIFVFADHINVINNKSIDLPKKLKHLVFSLPKTLIHIEKSNIELIQKIYQLIHLNYNSKNCYISLLPNMKSTWGHHLQNEQIINKFLPFDYDHIAIAHKDFNPSQTIQNLKVYNYFTYAIYDLESKKSEYQFYIEIYFLFKIIESKVLDPKYKIIFSLYMGSLDFLPMYHQIIRLFKRFNFMCNIFYLNEIMPLLKGEIIHFTSTQKYYLELLKANDKNLLFVDNNLLSSRLKQYFGINLKVWPHFSFYQIDSNKFPIKTISDKPYIVYCPSLFQNERGIVRLLRLLENSASFLIENNIIFQIRTFDLTHDRSTFNSFTRGIKFNKNIKFVHGELSEELYINQIRQADLIILPYPAKHYSFRTSAILLDALTLLKPTIACNGTWLASIISEYSLGLSYQETNYKDFQDVLLRLKANHLHFQQNIKVFNKLKLFAVDHFINLLRNIISDEKQNMIQNPTFSLNIPPSLYFRRIIIVKKMIRLISKFITINRLVWGRFKNTQDS